MNTHTHSKGDDDPALLEKTAQALSEYADLIEATPEGANSEKAIAFRKAHAHLPEFKELAEETEHLQEACASTVRSEKRQPLQVMHRAGNHHGLRPWGRVLAWSVGGIAALATLTVIALGVRSTLNIAREDQQMARNATSENRALLDKDLAGYMIALQSFVTQQQSARNFLQSLGNLQQGISATKRREVKLRQDQTPPPDRNQAPGGPHVADENSADQQPSASDPSNGVELVEQLDRLEKEAKKLREELRTAQKNYEERACALFCERLPSLLATAGKASIPPETRAKAFDTFEKTLSLIEQENRQDGQRVFAGLIPPLERFSSDAPDEALRVRAKALLTKIRSR
jgi:hypothetical protein